MVPREWPVLSSSGAADFFSDDTARRRLERLPGSAHFLPRRIIDESLIISAAIATHLFRETNQAQHLSEMESTRDCPLLAVTVYTSGRTWRDGMRRGEYESWHAQGIRMWGYKDPWWVKAHGTFANGAVFDITQGFIYGHLAKRQPHNCDSVVEGSADRACIAKDGGLGFRSFPRR